MHDFGTCNVVQSRKHWHNKVIDLGSRDSCDVNKEGHSCEYDMFDCDCVSSSHIFTRTRVKY